MYTLNLDKETRSTVDLTSVGTHVYSRHPSTRVLCASYVIGGERTNVRRWRSWTGEAMPKDLSDCLRDPECQVVAWAAQFERLMLWHCLGIRVPVERFRCTQARARSMALPGKLDLAAKALQVPTQKQDQSIMLKWCRPLRSGGWADNRDEYENLCRYCDVDVLTEMDVGNVVRPMTDEEWLDYRINEEINDRGIPVDLDLAAAAQRYAADELADIKERLDIVTKGFVQTPKQFAKIKEWLNIHLPAELKLEPDSKGKISFDAAVREDLLAPDNATILQGDVREFVELVHDGGRASTSKFSAMLARGANEQRVYGAHILNGAGQTGRYSSTGLQTHNLVRDKLENIGDVIEGILRGEDKQTLIDIASWREDGSRPLEKGEPLEKDYNVLTILSRTLRPSIVADEGKLLVWSDLSAIEAIVNPWLSKENSASELLDYFASGRDIYLRQAVMTYNLKSEDQVTKAQRQAGGKVPILSFGFFGGAGAIMAMARAYGVQMDEDMAETLKHAWRDSNPWSGRFGDALDDAIMQAVLQPEQAFTAGRLTYMTMHDVLWCLLPCGRMLAYPFPRIEYLEGRWGPRDTVTCIKGSFHPKKGSSYWPRMKLWRGVVCENATQGFAASLLRWAVRELHLANWPVIGHTHDEILEEIEEDEAEEAKAVLHETMTRGPAYAAGLPLSAEAKIGKVYGI